MEVPRDIVQRMVELQVEARSVQGLMGLRQTTSKFGKVVNLLYGPGLPWMRLLEHMYPGTLRSMEIPQWMTRKSPDLVDLLAEIPYGGGEYENRLQILADFRETVKNQYETDSANTLFRNLLIMMAMIEKAVREYAATKLINLKNMFLIVERGQWLGNANAMEDTYALLDVKVLGVTATFTFTKMFVPSSQIIYATLNVLTGRWANGQTVHLFNRRNNTTKEFTFEPLKIPTFPKEYKKFYHNFYTLVSEPGSAEVEDYRASLIQFAFEFQKAGPLSPYVDSNICVVCNTAPVQGHCGRCNTVGYCSVECQKQDWETNHKKHCK